VFSVLIATPHIEKGVFLSKVPVQYIELLETFEEFFCPQLGKFDGSIRATV
jgi:hypothetical protein